MKNSLFILALVCAPLAYGQGGVPASPIHFSGPTGRPLAGATVTFCSSAGAGFPCSPLASIFTNAGLSIASPNPVTTDGNGNIPVIFAAPGVYVLSVTGSGITPTLVTATVAGSGGGNVVLSASNAFTGTVNTFPNINQIRFVDGTVNATPQAAIASCPSAPLPDCWVVVPPGTYAFPNNIRSHLHIMGHLPGIPAATITAATNLVWGTPPVDNKVIFTSASNVTLAGLWDFSIENVTADFLGNNAGIILQNGVFNNWFINLTIQNCGTGTCMIWNGGGVGAQSVVGNRFPGLSIFNAGKAIRMTATAPGVAANNTVSDYVINNISSIAIECVQQADTNTFRTGFLYGLGNAATGIIINSATPAVDSGCNDNKFLDLTTDVFNGGAYTGTLVQVNKSTGTVISPWSIGGGVQSGGGVEFATTGSPSATVCIASDFTASGNSNWCRFLGPVQIGTGGSSINKVFLVSGTLTYGLIAAQTCQEQPLAVTGATASTGVWSASPNPGLGNVNLSWSAHADAIANSVLVRVCNPTVGAITPTAVSWTVSGMQ